MKIQFDVMTQRALRNDINVCYLVNKNAHAVKMDFNKYAINWNTINYYL